MRSSRTIIFVVMILAMSSQGFSEGRYLRGLNSRVADWCHYNLTKLGANFVSSVTSSDRPVVEIYVRYNDEVSKDHSTMGDNIAKAALAEVLVGYPSLTDSAVVLVKSGETLIGRAPSSLDATRVWIERWRKASKTRDFDVVKLNRSTSGTIVVMKSKGPMAKMSSIRMLNDWKEEWPQALAIKWLN